MASKEELFPSIGTVAESTGQTKVDKSTAPEYDEERPVQEIESLCMNCGQNVSHWKSQFLRPFSKLSAEQRIYRLLS